MLLNHKLGDRLDAEVLWIASLARTDWMLRPRVIWNFETNWAHFRRRCLPRAAARFFGQFDNRDRVYTELRYSF